MELEYTWGKHCGAMHIAEAIGYTEAGDTIQFRCYGKTSAAAYAKLITVLQELNVIPQVNE